MLNVQYFIENGLTRETPVPEFRDSQRVLIYEVIRIIDGQVLFLPDHYARFHRSCELLHVPVFETPKEFESQLYQLIEANLLKNGNVKVELFTKLDGSQLMRMFVVPHQYPSEEQYRVGVLVGLLHAERENPQAKAAQLSVREMANRAIAEHNWYEVLLVDRNDCITEGSRSNVFFWRDGAFYTARSEKVLGGITRKKIIECIHNLGLTLIETDISTKELATFDAAFISGTSPKILPIAQVESVSYGVENKALRNLMKAFDQLIQGSLKKVD